MFHFWQYFWLTFLVVSLAYAWYSFYVPVNHIAWADSFTSAQQRGADSGKPMILYFTGDWCVPCRIMKRQVWADEEVRTAVNARFIPVAIEVDHPDVIGVTTVQGITVTRQDHVLTLNGAAGAETYEQVLRTLTFSTTSATAGGRTVVVQVTDRGGNVSVPRHLTVTLTDRSTFATIDVDQSGGAAAAQSDGLLVFAILAGVTSPSQLSGLVSSGGIIGVPEIVSNVQALGQQVLLDVDGNGSVSAQSDGLLIFAILAGVTSPVQLGNLVGAGATRPIPEIIEYVQTVGAASTTVSSAPASAAVLAASALSVLADSLPPSIPGTRDVALSASIENRWTDQSEPRRDQSHVDERVPLDAVVAAPPTRSLNISFGLGSSAVSGFVATRYRSALRRRL